MFSGLHAIAAGEDGRVFVDRDSELFRLILNFLRVSQRTKFAQTGRDYFGVIWRFRRKFCIHSPSLAKMGM